MHHLEKAREAVAERMTRKETFEDEQGDPARGEDEGSGERLRRSPRAERGGECLEGARRGGDRGLEDDAPGCAEQPDQSREQDETSVLRVRRRRSSRLHWFTMPKQVRACQPSAP